MGHLACWYDMNKAAIAMVIPEKEHILLLHYTNGEQRKFDVTPYIRGSLYGKLSYEVYFRTVKSDERWPWCGMAGWAGYRTT